MDTIERDTKLMMQVQSLDGDDRRACIQRLVAEQKRAWAQQNRSKLSGLPKSCILTKRLISGRSRRSDGVGGVGGAEAVSA